ncbi:hypothetical protein ACHAWO_004225 [Cyclotella atomus]|uniref:Glycosyltransferase 61 catalytic domain-containing protein n=1 Tax=Cyclotella atomus TaxID=382360 RepID=A0ABD3QPU5_9STRA
MIRTRSRASLVVSLLMTILVALSPMERTTRTSCTILVGAANPSNINDPMEMGEQMAMQYTQQLETILQLTEAPIDTTNSRKSILNKGQKAFDDALQIFPDETLPHAHALFAKLCVKMEEYKRSLELFDEAIRRASLPLEAYKESTRDKDDDDDDDSKQIPQDILEAEPLVKQLILERNRAHFSHLQASIAKWDNANNALYSGGIPPETSPQDPLSVIEDQLRVFPNPHPQSLFDKASFLVLLLDSPLDAEEEDGDNTTAKAWLAHDVYTKAQTWAFGAYTHGKKRGLAGGKPCSGKESEFGVAIGGTGWSNYALESKPFQSTPSSSDGETKSFTGVVTLQNVLVSGKDAVISGYGSNCQVYVPHRYVNLADNIPLVTSWESSVHEITMGDNPLWSTYIPSNDYTAYGGKIRKDDNGNDVLKIPDPKPKSAKGGLDSVVLLTGYASDNYYHFVAEVLSSLVMMKDRIDEALSASNDDGKGNAKDVILIPNLQHEFVEGFLRLMLPNAFVNGKPSKHLVQWGATRRNTNTTSSKYLTPHPIAYVRRLHAAIWDQPKDAPSPVAGAAHCLTPSPVLIAMRQAVWDAVDNTRIGNGKKNSKFRVIYCPRATSPTRSLKDEAELLEKLRETVTGLGGDVILFEKAKGDNSTFASTKSPLEFVIDAVELFRSADIVVGVHGASLANIAFSKPGTRVIELGFEGLPQASHYRHISIALGLKHVDVWLEKDSRSLGATQVKLRAGGVQKVFDSVVDGLQDASQSHHEL